MTTLQIPPIVSQRAAVLPDGTVDPAGATDCGEACLASALSVKTGYMLSPGCIRQALGLPESYGVTNGSELANFLTAFGIPSTVLSPEPAAIWHYLEHLRHYRRFAIVLGVWAGPELHWEVAFSRGGDSIRHMDPWTEAYVDFTKENFLALYRGTMVSLDYR